MIARRKPETGDRITIKTGYFADTEATVVALLGMMFTARPNEGIREGVTHFLYYDRLKGESWEYTKSKLDPREAIIASLGGNAFQLEDEA